MVARIYDRNQAFYLFGCRLFDAVHIGKGAEIERSFFIRFNFVLSGTYDLTFAIVVVFACTVHSIHDCDVSI